MRATVVICVFAALGWHADAWQPTGQQLLSGRGRAPRAVQLNALEKLTDMLPDLSDGMRFLDKLVPVSASDREVAAKRKLLDAVR